MARKTARRPLRVINEAFVPDERKAELRKRLARLKGQVEGVERMLEQNRPCADILTQISAAQEALRGASRVMVRNYLEKCATTAIREGREQEALLLCQEVGHGRQVRRQARNKDALHAHWQGGRQVLLRKARWQTLLPPRQEGR